MNLCTITNQYLSRLGSNELYNKKDVTVYNSVAEQIFGANGILELQNIISMIAMSNAVKQMKNNVRMIVGFSNWEYTFDNRFDVEIKRLITNGIDIDKLELFFNRIRFTPFKPLKKDNKPKKGIFSQFK